ncbi:MAG: hypothetical protein HY791_23850, partial [Deltaproteobacteria bacterium]|nr:hypothetical protein [Deltaproteobacteria bacterium]
GESQKLDGSFVGVQVLVVQLGSDVRHQSFIPFGDGDGDGDGNGNGNGNDSNASPALSIFYGTGRVMTHR